MSCTLTHCSGKWNEIFRLEWTPCYNLLGSQHTALRGKSRQVSQVAKSKYRETYHQGWNYCLPTGRPSHRTLSLRCTHDCEEGTDKQQSVHQLPPTIGKLFHVRAEHERTCPQTFVLVPSPQINPHAKSTINYVWPDGSFSTLQTKRWAPDPKGSLSLAIPLWAIHIFIANGEVTNSDMKCRPYKKYSLEEWRQMGNYACDWQKPHAISRDDVSKMVSEITVWSIIARRTTS